MKTLEQSISQTKVLLWYLIVNFPLVAISWYVHYLLVSISETYGHNFMESFGLWFLMAFKIVGANLILTVIIFDRKIKKS